MSIELQTTMKLARSRNYVITTQKVLSAAELDHLKQVCNRNQSAEMINKPALLITLALETGMRATEVLNLRVKDFDPKEHTIFIRSLKGSNARSLPLRPKTSLLLLRFILQANKAEELGRVNREASVFGICYQRLYQYWEVFKPNPDKTFHCLRHTFAVEFYKKSKDLKAVQLALGHRNVENTMVYVDFLYSHDHMRKLMFG